MASTGYFALIICVTGLCLGWLGGRMVGLDSGAKILRQITNVVYAHCKDVTTPIHILALYM